MALTISTSPLSVTQTGTYYFTKANSAHTSVLLQVSGTFTSLTFSIQGSADGSNAFACAAIDLGTRQIVSGGSTISATDSTTYAWEIPAELLSCVGISTTGPATGTAVFTVSSGSFIGLPVNATANAGTSTTGNQAFSGTLTVTSANSSALAVGRQGATNPTLQVDASTSLSLTGLKVKSAGTGAGLALSVVEASGTNNNLTIDAMGSGTITIAGTSTGAVTITPATTITGALTCSSTLSCTALTATSIAATGTVALTNNMTITDAKNIILNASTGTKIGTATTQKLGFYNATPVVQVVANSDVSTGAAGGTTTVFLNTTFTGGGTAQYTLGGVVAALKAYGLLAV